MKWILKDNCGDELSDGDEVDPKIDNSRPAEVGTTVGDRNGGEPG